VKEGAELDCSNGGGAGGGRTHGGPEEFMESAWPLWLGLAFGDRNPRMELKVSMDFVDEWGLGFGG